MGSTFVMVLVFLAGGGGSDLADYISPADYWKHKDVQMTVEAMASEIKQIGPAELSKLIDDLASPDAQTRQDTADKTVAVGTAALKALHQASESPAPSVATGAKRIISRIEAGDQAPLLRRLMAIRTLGELGKNEGITALEPLLKSEERFVADYAAEAIDRIEGKAFHRGHPADLRSDVFLLPAGSRAVIQLLGPPGGPVNMEEELKRIAPMPGMDVSMPGHALQLMLVSLVERLGNIRLDALSVGISGEIGPNSGYVTLICRGTYNSQAVSQWMHAHQIQSKQVGGIDVFQPPGGGTVVFFPDDHHAAYISFPQGAAPPTEEVVAAMKSGNGGLKDAAEMRELIDRAPAGQPLWGAARVTGSYAKDPVLAPFDTIELGSARVNDSINLTIVARGMDAAKAQIAARAMQDRTRQWTDRMQQTQQSLPLFKTFADAMASVKCDPQDGNATLTAKLTHVQSGLFLPPMMRMRPPPRTGPAPAASRPAPPGGAK